MKRQSRGKQKVVKGMPSAVLLSMVIHAALFLLAGTLVVFTVVKKKEQKFEPPHPVERPKMKLKKPKVKVKKTSRPKPTQRIVTKMNRASMPDIQLPEMSGMGEDLGGVVGGFDMMPDLEEVTVFGSGQSIGNDLIGTFYDFNRDRNGRAISMDGDMYRNALMKFFRKGWKESSFARFYRSPKKLYATTICVPTILSTRAPQAFGEPADTAGWCWAVVYSGQLVSKEDTTFRFWGAADDVMMVRVNGKIVLNACYHSGAGGSTYGYFSPLWQSDSPDSFKDFMGNRTSVVSDRITLEANVPQKIEILIGEIPGGAFGAMLAVEVEGEEYEVSRQGGPILPVFKMAELSHELQDAIYKDLIPDEVCLTNGPVFNDYGISDQQVSGQRDEAAGDHAPVPEVEEEARGEGLRLWSGEGIKTIEAEFVNVISENVVLKDRDGKVRKIPLSRLSEADRQFVELAQPPEFNMDFSKKSAQWRNPQSPFSRTVPPTMHDYVFTAKLKQNSVGQYNHTLDVEFFVISKQELGQNIYRLIDHRKDKFIPAECPDRSYKLSGNKTTLYSYSLYNQDRGEQYAGYVVVVTDERGQIIQHSESSRWLFEYFDKLRELPVGAYIDRTCTRIHPVGPKPTFY